MYDIEKIKEELKPINIIHYLGVKYKRSGNNIFILCPEHEEKTGMPDKHIGNCVLNDTFYNAYHCFGCGASGNCFKLIACLEGLNLKKDFSRILEIAADACGGSEFFEVSNKGINKKRQQSQKEKAVNLLSKDQLDLIGLGTYEYPCIYTECFGDEHFDDAKDGIKNVDLYNRDPNGLPITTYLYAKSKPYSINHLLNNDLDLYINLVKGKSSEAMARFKKLALTDWTQYEIRNLPDKAHFSYFKEELKDYYKSKYLEAEAIWKLFSTQDELDSIDNSWIYEYNFVTEKKPGAIL